MFVGFRGATWRAIAYYCVTLFTSVLFCTVVATLFALGAVTLIIAIGLPILVATLATARGLGRVDRELANMLLHAKIAPAPPVPGTPVAGAGVVAPAGHMRDSTQESRATSWWRHTASLLADPSGWRHFAWIILAPIPMTVGFALAVLAVTIPFAGVAALATAAYFEFGSPKGDYTDLAPATVQLIGWSLWGVGLLLLLLAPLGFWAVRGWAALTRSAARWALGPSRADGLSLATARADRAEAQVRIDQELHDSIGHMITMTVIQAGAASHVFDSDPEFARRALKTIEERGRSAMGDLDRIIATMHGSAPTQPLFGADDVAALVADARAAGVEIASELELGGEMPAPVGRAVHSTVREALTNAARHAPGTPVTLTVTREDGDVRVLVINPLPKKRAVHAGGDDARTGGRGLTGIRDRVELLGGTVTFGATPRAGSRPGVFTVDARIPVGAPVAGGKDA